MFFKAGGVSEGTQSGHTTTRESAGDSSMTCLCSFSLILGARLSSLKTCDGGTQRCGREAAQKEQSQKERLSLQTFLSPSNFTMMDSHVEQRTTQQSACLLCYGSPQAKRRSSPSRLPSRTASLQWRPEIHGRREVRTSEQVQETYPGCGEEITAT